MLSKHIDAIALAVIVLAMVAFSNAPKVIFARDLQSRDIRVQNAVGHTSICPLDALLARVR